MKRYRIETRETVTRHYIVEAPYEADARRAFERGDYVHESPGETVDCEIVAVSPDAD